MNKQDKEIFAKTIEDVSKFNVASNIDRLDAILKEYNLKELYAKAISIYSLYNSKGVVFNITYILNVFEGCVYSNCTRKQTKVALMVAMFRFTGDNASMCPFTSSDIIRVQIGLSNLKTALDDLIKADEYKDAKANLKLLEDYEVLNNVYLPHQLGKKYANKLNPIFKPNTDTVLHILYDAYYMFLYSKPEFVKGFVALQYEDYLADKQDAFENHEDNKFNAAGFEEKFSRYNALLVWQTSWAKRKAFTKNWPAVLLQAKNAFIKRDQLVY